MRGGSTTGAYVSSIMPRVGAAFHSLPSRAELAAIFGPETFVDAFREGVVEVVPRFGQGAFNDAVRVAAKTYCTAG